MNKLNTLLKRSGSYDLNKAQQESTEKKTSLFKSKRSVSLCSLTSHKSLPTSAGFLRKSVSFSGPFPTNHRPLSLTTSPNTSGNSSPKLSERKSTPIATPQKTLPSNLQASASQASTSQASTSQASTSQASTSQASDIQGSVNSSWDSGERKFDLTNLAKQLPLADMPKAVVSKSIMTSDFMITVDNTIYTPSSMSNLLALAQLAHPECPLSSEEKRIALQEANIHKTLPSLSERMIRSAMDSSWNSDEGKFDLVNLGQELPLADMPKAVTSEGTRHSDFMLQIGSTIYTPSSQPNLLSLAEFAHPESPLNSTEKKDVLQKASVHKVELPELTVSLLEQYQTILNNAWDTNLRSWDLEKIAEKVSVEEMPRILQQSNGLPSEFVFNLAGEKHTASSMANLLALGEVVHPDSIISNLEVDKAIRVAIPVKSKYKNT